MPTTTDEIAVNDLLGRPPGWLLRSGITFIFWVIALMLIMAAFIRYPDRLTGIAIVQHENPPITISPGITAPLDTLLVTDGDLVHFTQVLGVLKSGADWQQVLTLDTTLASNDLWLDVNEHLFDNLGELQPTYAARATICETYRHLVNASGLGTQLQSTSREILRYLELMATTEQQIALLDRQLELEAEDHQRAIELAEANVISTRELEQQEKVLLAAQERKLMLEADIIRYKLENERLKQRRTMLSLTHSDERQDLERKYAEITDLLKSKIHAWKERYLLQAPVEGYVILNDKFIEKQLVNTTDELLTIQPEAAASSPLMARISVPATGIGKLNEGDKVILSLDAYPEREFGVLLTTLEEVSVLPRMEESGDLSYTLSAPLSDSLVTSFGHRLKLSITNPGTGTVITRDRSVLSRIFEQLIDLIKTQ